MLVSQSCLLITVLLRQCEPLNDNVEFTIQRCLCEYENVESWKLTLLCTCSKITMYLTALQLSSASFVLLQSRRELTVLMRFFSLLTTRRLYKSQPSPIHALIAGGVCTKCQPAH